MTSTTNNSAAPVSVGDRIFALDALRGFALLGILIINIQAFAMIEAAYFNPLAYGDMSGLNGWVWKLSHIFGDLKFMALFSMMFGAGVVLMTGRIEAIWIFQLIISPIWLRHFRFGPFEWLWRSFTYLKLQPMRIRSNG